MKNIGFMICAVGNGHLTQAKTVYNILRKNGYNIPIVISCGKKENKEWKKIFKESDYVNEKIYITEDATNNLKTVGSYINFIRSIFKPMNAYYYFQKYKLDLFISFWTPSLIIKFPVPCLSFAYQYNIEGSKFLDLTIKLSKKLQIPVSIGRPNKYSSYWVPNLIGLNPIKRNINTKKICLAYSVSGNDFINTMNKIALKNPNYEINFFFKKKVSTNLPSNIIVHNISRDKFRELLKITHCVICTSGNELIQECVFNKIPVATMPCSDDQFEQHNNFNKYVNILKYAVKMDEELDLEKLSNRDMNEVHNVLIKSLDNREEKIINLIKQFI